MRFLLPARQSRRFWSEAGYPRPIKPPLTGDSGFLMALRGRAMGHDGRSDWLEERRST